jgi:peptidoglycan/LPS O-acetylase OafA/YrhL
MRVTTPGITRTGIRNFARWFEVVTTQPGPAVLQPDKKSPSGSPARVPELDGIRGIAIILVLLTHVFSYSMLPRQWSGLPRLVMHATVPGWLGVDLFFVLSGFLITGILLDSRADPHYFRNFYARRALRILPLYLLVLTLLAVFYRGSGPFVLLGLLMSVNVASLLHIAVVSGGGALWSLAVEEHFYLIWPWLIRFLKPVVVLAVSAAICVLEPVVRALARSAVEDVYLYSWFRFDGLAWGAMLAVFVRWNGADRRRALKVAGALMLAAVTLAMIGMPYGILHRGNRLGAALQFSIGEMAFAGGILAVVTMAGSTITAIFRSYPLTLSGYLSYCLYIMHMMVVDLFDVVCSRFIDLEAAMGRFSFIIVRAVVAIALCYSVAAVSGRYFEKPLLELKRYFVPRKAKSRLLA